MKAQLVLILTVLAFVLMPVKPVYAGHIPGGPAMTSCIDPATGLISSNIIQSSCTEILYGSPSVCEGWPFVGGQHLDTPACYTYDSNTNLYGCCYMRNNCINTDNPVVSIFDGTPDTNHTKACYQSKATCYIDYKDPFSPAEKLICYNDNCGNGKLDLGEQCDDGPNNGACPKTCSTSCTKNTCAPTPACSCNPPNSSYLLKEVPDPSQCPAGTVCTNHIAGGTLPYGCYSQDSCATTCTESCSSIDLSTYPCSTQKVTICGGTVECGTGTGTGNCSPGQFCAGGVCTSPSNKCQICNTSGNCGSSNIPIQSINDTITIQGTSLTPNKIYKVELNGQVATIRNGNVGPGTLQSGSSVNVISDASGNLTVKVIPADTPFFSSLQVTNIVVSLIDPSQIPCGNATIQQVNPTCTGPTYRCTTSGQACTEAKDSAGSYICGADTYTKQATCDDFCKGLPSPDCKASGTCTSAAGIPCGDNNTGIQTAIGCIPTQPVPLITTMLKIAFGIGGGVALIMMILGAYQMLASAGNPDNLKGGQERFSAAVIGLVFIIFAVIILKIIGVDILKLPGLG